MRCLVTGAAGLISLPPGERLQADGHEVCGIDAFIDYYSRQINAQNLSIARSWERFTFISDINETNIQATLNEKAVGEAVNIVEGDCVSPHEMMQILPEWDLCQW
jgi:nucleoside-diphosphate-sugar epimerase